VLDWESQFKQDNTKEKALVRLLLYYSRIITIFLLSMVVSIGKSYIPIMKKMKNWNKARRILLDNVICILYCVTFPLWIRTFPQFWICRYFKRKRLCVYDMPMQNILPCKKNLYQPYVKISWYASFGARFSFKLSQTTKREVKINVLYLSYKFGVGHRFNYLLNYINR
jgi:hypothetical protein